MGLMANKEKNGKIEKKTSKKTNNSKRKNKIFWVNYTNLP